MIKVKVLMITIMLIAHLAGEYLVTRIRVLVSNVLHSFLQACVLDLMGRRHWGTLERSLAPLLRHSTCERWAEVEPFSRFWV